MAEPPPLPRRLLAALRAGAVPIGLLVVAVLWTWPALITGAILGHKPDAPGTVWFVSAAPRLLSSLTDPLTGWPAGATYGRPDSFVLMVLGALTAPLLGAAWAHALLGLLGVWLSAWAAEAFARALGATRPWSVLAGLAFATSGLASTALLEGYVYHVVDPWLPLLGLFWHRATQPGGSARDGALSGLFFVLCLLSTAWLGLAAAVLVGGFFAAAALAHRGQTPWRPALTALGVVALPLWAYVAAFIAGGGDGESDLAHAGHPMHFFSFGLVRLAAAPPSIDVTGNSQSAVLPGVCLALFLVSPVVLKREGQWRGVAATGLLALALTLLPGLDWGVGGEALSVLLASLARFPERLGWTFVLCLGVIGARVASRLALRWPRAAYGLLLGALIDAFVLPRMPLRQRETLSTTPSAYRAARGPVLDLWPEDIEPAPAWTLRTTNLGCAYQADHGRPIADHCVATPGQSSPRVVLGRWVLGRLLTDDAAAVELGLGELGFTTLMLHADLFSAGDRARLRAALADVDAAPIESTDGGEHVVAYTIPTRPGADPQGAWAQWSH